MEAVGVSCAAGVETVCKSRSRVETGVPGGSVGRLVGVLGEMSMLCVREQDVSSMNATVETTLVIFIDAMLP